MRYTLVAAALMGLTMAMPYADEPKKDDWTPAPPPPPKKDDWKPAPAPEPKKDDWKPAPAPEPKKDTWAPAPAPTQKPDWKPAPVEEKKCSTEIVYTTKECGADKDKWDNCKDVVKTKTEYPEKCTWEAAPAPSPKPDWKPAPVEEKKCSTVIVYTTKECGADKDKWDNCKDVTKTKTEYPEKCTWAPAPVKETWAPAPAPVKETTTWAEAPAPAKTPEAATWAPAPAPVKPSATVAAPVAKWTGAADKQAVGMGALAIAAVAALL